jgi:hypothetical protein
MPVVGRFFLGYGFESEVWSRNMSKCMCVKEQYVAVIPGSMVDLERRSDYN